MNAELTDETDPKLSNYQIAEILGIDPGELARWKGVDRVKCHLPAPYQSEYDDAIDFLGGVENLVQLMRDNYREIVEIPQSKLPDPFEPDKLLHPELAARLEAETKIQRKPITERLISFDTPPQQDPDLIQGWLPVKGITVMYGPPGAGKSFLALDMAMAVHNGTDSVLGVSTGQPVDVTYILGEGVAGIGERVGAWQMKGNEQSTLPQFVNGLNLGDDRDLDELTAALSQGSLLVIDTLSRCTPGIDENSTKDMSRIVANLDRIRETKDATILVIHHSGKDVRRGARGSTVLVGAIDAEIQVTGQVDQTIAVTSTKRRDGKAEETVHLTSRDIGKSMVLEQVKGAITEPAQWAEVLGALEDGMTSSRWEKAVELSVPTFRGTGTGSSPGAR